MSAFVGSQQVVSVNVDTKSSPFLVEKSFQHAVFVGL